MCISTYINGKNQMGVIEPLLGIECSYWIIHHVFMMIYDACHETCVQ